jgi:uncharacterized protein with PIN domain
MTEPTWVCEGCDVQFSTRKIDEWRALRVEISSLGGTRRLSETFDMCPDCQHRIVNLANPRTWPRSDVDLEEPPVAAS